MEVVGMWAVIEPAIKGLARQLEMFLAASKR